MSTEARAPVEDVETAIAALDRLESTAISADYADERQVQKDALTVDATLRDLSRKYESAIETLARTTQREADAKAALEEAKQARQWEFDNAYKLAEAGLALEKRAEAAEAALEEARRERDEANKVLGSVSVCREHTDEVTTFDGCLVCALETKP